jgi:hypothetical protein
MIGISLGPVAAATSGLRFNKKPGSARLKSCPDTKLPDTSDRANVYYSLVGDSVLPLNPNEGLSGAPELITNC